MLNTFKYSFFRAEVVKVKVESMTIAYNFISDFQQVVLWLLFACIYWFFRMSNGS